MEDSFEQYVEGLEEEEGSFGVQSRYGPSNSRGMMPGSDRDDVEQLLFGGPTAHDEDDEYAFEVDLNRNDEEEEAKKKEMQERRVLRKKNREVEKLQRAKRAETLKKTQEERMQELLGQVYSERVQEMRKMNSLAASAAAATSAHDNGNVEEMKEHQDAAEEDEVVNSSVLDDSLEIDPKASLELTVEEDHLDFNKYFDLLKSTDDEQEDQDASKNIEPSDIHQECDDEEHYESDYEVETPTQEQEFFVGAKVRAKLFNWTSFYTGAITSRDDDGHVSVLFEDGERVDSVSISAIEIIENDDEGGEEERIPDKEMQEEKVVVAKSLENELKQEEKKENAPEETEDDNDAEHSDTNVDDKVGLETMHVDHDQQEESASEKAKVCESPTVEDDEMHPVKEQEPQTSEADEIKAVFWDTLEKERDTCVGTPPPTPMAAQQTLIENLPPSTLPPGSPPPPPPPPPGNVKNVEANDSLKVPLKRKRKQKQDILRHVNGLKNNSANEENLFDPEARVSIHGENARLHQAVGELKLKCAALQEELKEADRQKEKLQEKLFEAQNEVNAQKAENFSLMAELKELKNTNATRTVLRTALSNGESIAKDELARIEKEMAEQDRLLAGYQKENEKLLNEVRNAEQKAQDLKTSMYRANMQIGFEQNKSSDASKLNADILHRELQAEQRVRMLEEELRELQFKYEKILAETKQRPEKDGSQEMLQSLRKELAEARFEHLSEAKNLKEKLAWYVENQALLDEKERMISELNARIEILENGRGTSLQSRVRESLPSDSKKIRMLEKQVKELEEGLRKRNPDCLANLILAAGPNEEEKETRRQLREKLKQLEEKMEAREKSHSSRVRTLRQEHERVKFRYEKIIQELQHEAGWNGQEGSSQYAEESKVPSSTNVTPSTEARIKSLEEELVRVRNFYRKKIEDLSKKSSSALRSARREGPIAHADAVAQRDVDKLRAARTALEARVEELEDELQRLRNPSSALQEKAKTIHSLKEQNRKLEEELLHLRVLQRRRTQSGGDSATNPQDTPGWNKSRSRSWTKESMIENSRDEGLVEMLEAVEDQAENADMQKELHRKINLLEKENAQVAHRWETALQRAEETVERLHHANVELQQQLGKARRELAKPKAPSLAAQEAIAQKVTLLEQKLLTREQELRYAMNQVKRRGEMELREAESRHEAVVAKKNLEIQRFRDELDSLIQQIQQESV